MTDAAVLRCPSCGSPADPSAQRCPFCKSRLATVSCPSCFALMFDGTKFCPHCGAARARVEKDQARLQCPSCRRALERIAIGATALMECASCDGIWADADSFEHLCANSEARAAVLHRLERPTPEPATQRVQYRQCPLCGKMMNRVNFSRVSGTVVDVCKGHGTWLDAGELHQIVTFIQNGGLERARDLQIQELKEQERNARDAELRAARERGRADPHHATGINAPRSPLDLLDVIDAIRRNS
jgi:Zn-finger nucleic acid-binding protein